MAQPHQKHRICANSGSLTLPSKSIEAQSGRCCRLKQRVKTNRVGCGTRGQLSLFAGGGGRITGTQLVEFVSNLYF